MLLYILTKCLAGGSHTIAMTEMRPPTIGAKTFLRLATGTWFAVVPFLRSISLIASFALVGGFAIAETDLNSANYIMPGCRALLEPDPPKDTTTEFLSAQCGAMVRRLAYTSSANVCPPNAVGRDEAIRIVVKYIDDLPARLHERFFPLALEALRAAWPCK
jgi:hypothetical protein